MFAKLYNSEKYGQILVKNDTDSEDGSPEVRFYAQPEGFGICSLALGFKDSDEGFDSADEAFNNVDQEKAEEIISKMFEEGPLNLVAKPSE